MIEEARCTLATGNKPCYRSEKHLVSGIGTAARTCPLTCCGEWNGEVELADAILVLSKVARESFEKAGFAEKAIVVNAGVDHYLRSGLGRSRATRGRSASAMQAEFNFSRVSRIFCTHPIGWSGERALGFNEKLRLHAPHHETMGAA